MLVFLFCPEMKMIYSFETSVEFGRTTRRHISEDRTQELAGWLPSHTNLLLFSLTELSSHTGVFLYALGTDRVENLSKQFLHYCVM
jgi:hypothetical protein